MEPTALLAGLTINYRGVPATVLECWTSEQDAMDGFKNPAGAVIEWKDDGGMTHRCRLLWDWQRDESGAPVGPLQVDGLNGAELELWEP